MKFDATGRRYIDLSFFSLSSIPSSLQQIAALSDPGVVATMSWDPNIDQINWAISTALGSSFAGFVDGSAGSGVTMVANSLAASWTVSRISAGRFRITHNEDLAAVTDLAVVASARLSAGGTDDRYCLVTAETADSFDVLVNDVGAGAVDDDFYFHATRLVAA
jgi:hypothetical protein